MKLPSIPLRPNRSAVERSPWPHLIACRPWRSCDTQWVLRGGLDVAAGYVHWCRCRCPLLCFLSCLLRGWMWSLALEVIDRRSGTWWTVGPLQDNASWMPQPVDCSHFLARSLVLWHTRFRSVAVLGPRR